MWYMNICSCTKDKCFQYKSILWNTEGSTIIYIMLFRDSMFFFAHSVSSVFLPGKLLKLWVKHNSFIEKWFIYKLYSKILHQISSICRKKSTLQTSLGDFLEVLSLRVATDSHWLLHTPALVSCDVGKIGEGGQKIYRILYF